MAYHITSTDKVRSMGLKAYAAEHGWDYDKLIHIFEKSLYDKRYRVAELPDTFRKKNGQPYTIAWFWELRKVYVEEKGKS